MTEWPVSQRNLKLPFDVEGSCLGRDAAGRPVLMIPMSEEEATTPLTCRSAYGGIDIQSRPDLKGTGGEGQIHAVHILATEEDE